MSDWAACNAASKPVAPFHLHLSHFTSFNLPSSSLFHHTTMDPPGRHRGQGQSSGGPLLASQAEYIAVQSDPSSQDTDRGGGRTRKSTRLTTLTLSHPSEGSGSSSPRRSPRKGKGKLVETDLPEQETIVQTESSSSLESYEAAIRFEI